MSDEIVLYSNPYSRGRVAHYMLEEVGAPYRIELLDFAKRDHKTDAYLAINPMGKIPALVHRGVVVTEVAAICAYLADAFPTSNLAPAPTAPERGTYLRWLFFMAGSFEHAITDRMSGRPNHEKRSMVGYGTYEDTLATLEKALTPGPFVLGERFSAADVYIASGIGWGLMTKALEPRETFATYAARIRERPAFQRFSAQSDALVKQLTPAK